MIEVRFNRFALLHIDADISINIQNIIKRFANRTRKLFHGIQNFNLGCLWLKQKKKPSNSLLRINSSTSIIVYEILNNNNKYLI